MANVETYLDQLCLRLRVDPARAEEIRQEILTHVKDLVEEYMEEGLTREAATDRALTWLGDADQLRVSLDSVHEGAPWWIQRLKGLGVGMLLGTALTLLLLPVSYRASLNSALELGAMMGGAIGLLSTPRRYLIVGWIIGSLGWTLVVMGSAVAAVFGEGGPRGGLSEAMDAGLLALVFGGLFGLAVGAGSMLLLSLTSRGRPVLR